MLQEGGGKTLLRVWEGYGKKFLSPDFFTKKLKKAFFSFFSSFLLKYSQKFFLLHQGVGSPGKFSFSAVGGVKNCPREGDCVLKGQPIGIPPPSPPMTMMLNPIILVGSTHPRLQRQVGTRPPRRFSRAASAFHLRSCTGHLWR